MPSRVLANAVAVDAIANIGVVEDAGNDNHGKYIKVYLESVDLIEGQPWCAAFAYFRYEQASIKTGVPLPSGFPKSGYVPDFVAWAKKNNRWVGVESAKESINNRPQAGDLLCFWFKDKDRHAHIGIVVDEADARGCFTVEGNTNDGDPTTVERNGGGVYKRRRDWKTWGEFGGYIRMDAVKPEPAKTSPKKPQKASNTAQ